MATNAKTSSGKMKGGVRKRGGLWAFTLYLGLQPAQRCVDCEHREWLGPQRFEACPKCGGELRETTEPRQFTRGGHPTSEAAQDARAAMRLQYKGRGNAPELVSKITLATFLRDVYLPAIEASKLKQTTKEGYRRNVRHHLIGPAARPFPIGLTELRKLTTRQIKAHYVELGKGYEVEDVLRTKYGRPRRDKKTREVLRGLVRRPGLGEESVRRVHATLHAALEMATTDDHPYLSRNPAKKAAKDVGDGDAVPRELPAWSAEELIAFLTSQRDTPNGPLWHILAQTGMRRGEACGLQRGDVDLDKAKLTLRRTRVPVEGKGRSQPGRVITSSLKNKRVREVDLDTATVEILRSVLWSSVSPADVTGEGQAASRWLFGADGQPLNPNSVTYEFRKAVAASGQRHIPLHGLRHTHATILLSAGVPLETVSKRLGHSSSVITLTVYSHYLPGAQQAAVAVLESMGAERAE